MARILVAGQDWETLEKVVATVSGEGHQVESVTSGLDAYEFTLKEQPDLVMLETNLPVFSGFETCRMLREDPEVLKSLPIIFLTVDKIDSKTMESLHASDQLPKIHSSVELQEMLVKHLGDKAVA